MSNQIKMKINQLDRRPFGSATLDSYLPRFIMSEITHFDEIIIISSLNSNLIEISIVLKFISLQIRQSDYLILVKF